MIGYYVHHHGRGHLHRAQALAAVVSEPLTILSSLPRPPGWSGRWVGLPRDDLLGSPEDVVAGGTLHWAPLGEAGMRARSAIVSAWLEHARPRLVVADVSVEIALLTRLHGTPVISVVLPGRRTDPAHLLGYRASTALVACSPVAARRWVPGLPDDLARRVVSLGAVSRFEPDDVPSPRADRERHVVVLRGRGGGRLTSLSVDALRSLAPQWHWTLVGGNGNWVEDVSPLLRRADVVITNAGESGLADVAAHRRPAIVVPAERPFAEQVVTASLLDAGDWPTIVLPRLPEDGRLPGLLDRAAHLDGRRWQTWCDGRGAHRFADLVAEIAPLSAWPA